MLFFIYWRHCEECAEKCEICKDLESVKSPGFIEYKWKICYNIVSVNRVYLRLREEYKIHERGIRV